MEDLKYYTNLAVAGILSILWFDLRALRKTFITKAHHDELCTLKLCPIRDDLAEIKADIKTLIRSNS